MDLREIFESLRRLAGTDADHRTWVDRMEERYLRLDRSEPLIGVST